MGPSVIASVASVGRQIRESAVVFGAGAILLVASLVNFLTHNDYPLFRPETAIVVGGILIVCGLVTVLYNGQRQWGRSVLEGLIAALFVDLNTDSWLLIAIAGLGVAAFTYVRRTSSLRVLLVIGTVVLLTTAVAGHAEWLTTKMRPGADAPVNKGPSDRPTIVHLILDEHIGIEGLPASELGAARRLRDDLRDFYLNSGFVVYGGAYSEHLHTPNAIPYTLNYGSRVGVRDQKTAPVADPTSELGEITERGYRLTVIQSNYLDLCSGARFYECVTYNMASLRPTLPLPLSRLDRASLMALKFAALSHLAKTAARAWNLAAYRIRERGGEARDIDLFNDSITSSASALLAFDVVIERLRDARPGEAYLAHILLPHFPYLVDSNCRYLPWRRWNVRSSAAPLNSRRIAYYEQVRCATSKVSAALDALSKSAAGKNAIVIIHGDHGSRLTQIDPTLSTSGRYSDSDMVAGYSTLFAVRVPGMAPSYTAQRVPIARLLGEFAAAGFQKPPSLPAVRKPSIVLDDDDWNPVRRAPLPRSWVEGANRPILTR